MVESFKNLNYHSRGPFYIFNNYDDLSHLQAIKDYYPQIIWAGKTRRKNVKTNLYAHYNEQNEIDSLIVDTGYFFGEEEDYIDEKLKSITIVPASVPSILSHPDFKPAN